jgi:hypothetical protein
MRDCFGYEAPRRNPIGDALRPGFSTYAKILTAAMLISNK